MKMAIGDQDWDSYQKYFIDRVFTNKSNEVKLIPKKKKKKKCWENNLNKQLSDRPIIFLGGLGGGKAVWRVRLYL